MKKHAPIKKLALQPHTIAQLSAPDLEQVAGGLRLTRPYTKVSVCTGGGACPSEVCG
jgi:hypothetical protein